MASFVSSKAGNEVSGQYAKIDSKKKHRQGPAETRPGNDEHSCLLWFKSPFFNIFHGKTHYFDGHIFQFANCKRSRLGRLMWMSGRAELQNFGRVLSCWVEKTLELPDEPGLWRFFDEVSGWW